MNTAKKLRGDLDRAELDREAARIEANNAKKDLANKVKDHEKTIDAIIDALGIRDAYPDVKVERQVWDVRPVPGGVDYSGYRFGPRYEQYQRTVTDTEFGRVKFLSDVAAAKESKKVSDAAARLAAALKSAK